MRVLYDISALGLGHLYPDARGGSARAERHLAEALARSSACELLLCANCSSVAHAGCAEFLASHEQLRQRPLLGPSAPALRSLSRRMHGALRAMVPGGAFPAWLRSGARLVDQRAHPPVSDADPPVDVFHSGGVPLPPRRAGRGAPRFLTVFDVRHLSAPAATAPGHALSAGQTLASLHPEDWVITASAAARGDLIQHGVAPAERIFVTPLSADAAVFHPGVDPGARPAGLPDGQYFLALNTSDLRKNTHAVVRAFTGLVAGERLREVALVLAGVNGADPPAMSDALARAREAGARVVRLGYLSDPELAEAYRGAVAFVYPSLHEGFGLPPLEAMRCGTPVIASNVSAIPEVVGDAGILTAPDDLDAIAQGMLDVYRDAPLRTALRGRGLARSAEFSWDRCAEDTLAAYRTALSA